MKTFHLSLNFRAHDLKLGGFSSNILPLATVSLTDHQPITFQDLNFPHLLNGSDNSHPSNYLHATEYLERIVPSVFNVY